MQNKRDRDGGTGKLTSHWEHNIFEVIEKREGVPVFRIRNINKKSDERVVHRNLLMLCNDLPLDVFKEVEAKEKNGQQHQRKKGDRKGQRKQGVDTSTDDDSGEDDDVVIVEEILGIVPEADQIQEEEGEPLVVEMEEHTQVEHDRALEYQPVEERAEEESDRALEDRSVVERESSVQDEGPLEEAQEEEIQISQNNDPEEEANQLELLEDSRLSLSQTVEEDGESAEEESQEEEDSLDDG